MRLFFRNFQTLKKGQGIGQKNKDGQLELQKKTEKEKVWKGKGKVIEEKREKICQEKKNCVGCMKTH